MNTDASLSWLVHGSAESPAPCVDLKAGPLSLSFHDGDLRYIRLGEHEMARRIYGAVRDAHWNTVPGTLHNLQILVPPSGDSFLIRFTCEHRSQDIHFVWEAVITGSPNGSIEFVFDGVAKSSFLRNRIGLCLLHPIRECAGVLCRTHHTDGSFGEAPFPEWVAEQQPIHGLSDLTGLSHAVKKGVEVSFAFEGDTFETEDQRNWIDASFKTYSTPLSRPFPMQVGIGDRVRQVIRLQLNAVLPLSLDVDSSGGRSSDGSVVVQCRNGDFAPIRVPQFGLGTALLSPALTPHEVGCLARLGLSHLRFDLRLVDPDWIPRLRSVANNALELGVALELAIHLPREGDGDLSVVAKELSRLKVDLTRAMVFRDGARSTLAADLEIARQSLADFGIPLGAGTQGDLYHLHLQPPPSDSEFLCWSINPQVHASDSLSIAETPEGVSDQISTLQAKHPDRALVISPVTLKPRPEPVFQAGESNPTSGEVPPEVDSRQMSLFGAVWTLAVLKAAFEKGIESITLFETTGLLGVMETELGSRRPNSFPSYPGGVFPIYHLLADIGEYSMGETVSTHATERSGIVSLLLRRGRRHRMLLGNLTSQPRRANLVGWGSHGQVRTLDESTVQYATVSPDAFRASSEAWNGGIIDLPPHAIVTLDLDSP